MTSGERTTQESAIDQLCTMYRDVPQIGLVLGAGVSMGSGVPSYLELARQLFSRATGSAAAEQGDTDPDKMIQYAVDHLEKREKLRLYVKEALYARVDTQRSHKMLGSKTYRDNATLDAVISFCAAIPGSPLVPESTARSETNPKVGGILTTNYDSLVEGAFGSKYGKKLLKPVGREGAREEMPGKRVIPVYHMHGYVSYVDDPDEPDRVKASDLVIAEEDYYRAFYNLLGFGNIVAMSFLRRFPCLFIGCSMQDRNIRRILYHLRRERIDATAVVQHYALLTPRAADADAMDDALLRSLGVVPIRLAQPLEEGPTFGEQVEAILERLYVSLDGLEPEYWQAVKRGGWSHKKHDPALEASPLG
ncbi:MAG: SIR2 family protein [Chloroflexi bacterium]|nr:SIR2 family protein [Chloroflexota bacterium]